MTARIPDAPAQSPLAPEPLPGGLTLLRWAFLDPLLLGTLSKKLTGWQVLSLLLRTYPWLIGLVVLFNVVSIMIMVIFKLPLRFPKAYVPEIVTIFQSASEGLVTVVSLASLSIKRLIDNLGWSLLGGAVAGLLVRDSSVAFIVTIVFCTIHCFIRSLTFGLSWGFVGGIGSDLVFIHYISGFMLDIGAGIVWGFVFGSLNQRSSLRNFTFNQVIAVGLSIGFSYGIYKGFTFGLAGSSTTGLAEFIFGGLTAITGFYLGFFRLPFYPWHFLSSLWRLNFAFNPYRCDAVIWLPLWGVTGRLAALAREQPEAARDFVDFLLARRPLQRGLAMRLSHAATAEIWCRHPLQPDYLNPPHIVAEVPRFAPSAAWQRQLESLRAELIGSQGHNHISLRQAAFARFLEALAEFRRQTLREPPRWHRDYLDALDVWQREAEGERDRLNCDAERLEPITPNVYRSGEALRPETDQAIFLGREDLRDRLAREILTAPNLPLLLIQGQRRVGKTSLLNFLPPLLGAGFKVVYQDLQDARITSVSAWLEDLLGRVARALGWPEEEVTTAPAPVDWLQAWSWFEDALAAPIAQPDYKLILALDEYEVLHGYLHQDPATGTRLLGAMRSFSQRQNRVVLLFVGSALLSELDAPNWSEYFVQTQRFRVDYLRKEDAVRLIVEPVKLRYPPEVTEHLFDLTQGHPALLQLLCKKLVDIANRNQKADMTMVDLDLAIEEAIERETFPMLVFWKQFCNTPASRQTVEQILRGESPTDAASRMRLAEHGFIVERDGAWRMRVPLFESWLRQYKDAYPLPANNG